jgi:hypothetical protein
MADNPVVFEERKSKRYNAKYKRGGSLRVQKRHETIKSDKK